jgi:integrase
MNNIERNDVYEVRQRVAEYFRNSRIYADTEITLCASALGISKSRLGGCIKGSWGRMRNEWLIKRLKRAMKEKLRSALSKRDFSVKEILKQADVKISSAWFYRVARSEWLKHYNALPSHQEASRTKVLLKLKELVKANIPYKELTVKGLYRLSNAYPTPGPWITASLLEAREELMARQTEQKHKIAEKFFRRTKKYWRTTRAHFASSMELSQKIVNKHFPSKQWQSRRKKWLLERTRKVMDEIYASSKSRSDFKLVKITRRVGINVWSLPRNLREEWRARLLTLSSAKEVSRKKILARLEALVEAGTPSDEISVKRLYKEAGVKSPYGPWLAIPLRAARLKLAEKLKSKTEEEGFPPTGSNIIEIPGGFIDLNSDVWNLCTGRGVIRRDHLRQDIADVCWPLLQEELKEKSGSLGTLINHYRAFRSAGDILCEEVPNVRLATLERVQRAWTAYSARRVKGRKGRRRSQNSKVKWALVKLFSKLFILSTEDSSINRDEMLRSAAWLQSQAKVSRSRPNKKFLTEEQLNTVLICCLHDIEAGFHFLSSKPDLLHLSTYQVVGTNASPVISMATTLMILIMAFTGLRPSSVLKLELIDSMSLRSALSAFIWRHQKKREENIVITPAFINRLVEYYAASTEEIRLHLGTKRLFLLPGGYGSWSASSNVNTLNIHLRNFIKRHNLSNGEIPLTLTATILRRTYATYQLYKGRNIWFVRAQLGHKNIQTTAIYTQLDRFEHPAQVKPALDTWGNRVLDFWHKPVDLEMASASDRKKLFSQSPQIPPEGDAEDDLAPCSTCESLFTGPEFASDWDLELIKWQRRMKKLEADPAEEQTLRREKERFAKFIENYKRVNRVGKG